MSACFLLLSEKNPSRSSWGDRPLVEMGMENRNAQHGVCLQWNSRPSRNSQSTCWLRCERPVLQETEPISLLITRWALPLVVTISSQNDLKKRCFFVRYWAKRYKLLMRFCQILSVFLKKVIWPSVWSILVSPLLKRSDSGLVRLELNDEQCECAPCCPSLTLPPLQSGDLSDSVIIMYCILIKKRGSFIPGCLFTALFW